MRFKAAVLQIAVIALLTLPGVASAATLKLVGLGDSLMAGYQLPADQSYTAQMGKALKAEGFDVTIENAAVSGNLNSGLNYILNRCNSYTLARLSNVEVN